MSYELSKYKEPNFSLEPFMSAPEVILNRVQKQGVAPDNYHATTIFPEYYKINGNWVLAKESRMDSVVVVVNKNNSIEIKEFRRLEIFRTFL